MSAHQFRIVLASHGELAKGMLNTVQMLLGEQENIVAYCLSPEKPVTDLIQSLEAEVEQYGHENIIFMTELLHGSPFNATVALTREHDIYHVSGINLAMLMGAVMARDEEGVTGEEICAAALEAAEDSYADVRKLLEAADVDDEEEEEL